jgi:RNA polymerase sigma-70 factor (ECF subfamily)
MDSGRGGQSSDVVARVSTAGLIRDADGKAARAPTLAEVYREHCDFVWRVAGRLGVGNEARDDVVHNVFLVVHRRLRDFDAARAIRPWLVGITRRVVADLRRGRTRARARLRLVADPVPLPSPEEHAARSQAAAMVRDFLDRIDPDQALVFMLADVEGMTAPAIAEALGAKLPTVYSRLRLAREKFERAIVRHRAADRRRDDERPQ